jgi:ubiquitin-protein ligase
MTPVRESPRSRRLKSDYKALELLASESNILSFTSYGAPPDFYILKFRGRGFWKPDAQGEVQQRDEHEVHIRLGASYPRMMPELAWKSRIFHPNISASGVVCLGGYGTYWVPSLALDELCGMLWDMIRYENYDETSPYNREAAAWAKNQTYYSLPIDRRPLRDKLAAATAEESLLPLPLPKTAKPKGRTSGTSPFRPTLPQVQQAMAPSRPPPPANDVVFIGEVVEAQAVTRRTAGDGEILFID